MIKHQKTTGEPYSEFKNKLEKNVYYHMILTNSKVANEEHIWKYTLSKYNGQEMEFIL